MSVKRSNFIGLIRIIIVVKIPINKTKSLKRFGEIYLIKEVTKQDVKSFSRKILI